MRRTVPESVETRRTRRGAVSRVILQVGACSVATMVSAIQSPAQESQPPIGGDVYAYAHCAACHGGLGYGGAGPRLRGDPLLEADTYVVGQILLGRGIMPSFGDKLSDREIAAVATYIRTSWGNDFGAVAPERVAEIRESLEEQQATDSAPPR